MLYKNNEVLHRVNIKFTDGSEESISFGSAQNARDFRTRQSKHPDVLSASYIDPAKTNLAKI